MKTKQEKEAEIALDVRDAMRARAEAEHANQLAERKEFEKEKKETIKFRRQKRAAYYYKVSYLFLTASGIGGGLTSIIFKNELNWYALASGLLLALFFALLADNTLKQQENELI